MFTLRDTVSFLAPARQDDLGKALYDRFREEPDTLIVPVVDAKTPVRSASSSATPSSCAWPPSTAAPSTPTARSRR
jgi:hypothetical protein